MDAAFDSELFIEFCCDSAAFALIFYEYIITVDREVALVWGRRFTGATVLFILNRYLALLKYPVYIIGNQALSDKNCEVIDIYGMVVQILPYVVWTAFSTLRIYAICGHNWRMALLVALSGSVQIAMNTYLFSQTYTENYPLPVGCLSVWSVPMETYNKLLIATRTSVIISDILVIGITWWKTYGIRKLVAQANVKVSLATLLLRDGTIYFMVLLIMNTFHIAFSLTGRFTLTLTLEEPLTAILVSRFLLNLREADASRGASDLDTITFPSFARQPNSDGEDSPHFVASFIAPLGAPLDHAFLPPGTGDVAEAGPSRHSGAGSEQDVGLGLAGGGPSDLSASTLTDTQA